MESSQSAGLEEVSGAWTACLDDLRGLTDRLIALVPVGDAERAADLAVKMFGTTMAAYLQFLRADAAHPAFLPSVGYYQMYGSPSPDTIYRTATIEDDGQYLISGHRGSVPEVTIMPFGAPTATGLQTFAPYDLGAPAAGPDATFEYVLSRERPDRTASWWRLEPGTRTLMLRSVSDAWGEHTEPRVAITRLDADPRRVRSAPESVVQRMRTFARVVEGMVMSGVRRMAQLQADGVVNRLVDVDYSANGGLGQQWYQEGCYALGPDQVLLIEARLPAGCEAFSLSLTDACFSTIDWANAHSSLNARQARIDEDGVLRVVVASSDPELHNWLDTTGHGFGAVQCRWSGGEAAPEVTAEVMATDRLMQRCGPQVARMTPGERSTAIRARQRGVQLRSHW